MNITEDTCSDIDAHDEEAGGESGVDGDVDVAVFGLRDVSTSYGWRWQSWLSMASSLYILERLRQIVGLA
jgi:hypothetical protein